jgi:hypothetical protein
MQLPIGHFGRMRFAFKTDSNSTSQESTQMHCHESNKILHSLPIDDHGMHFQIFQSASSIRHKERSIKYNQRNVEKHVFGVFKLIYLKMDCSEKWFETQVTKSFWRFLVISEQPKFR